MGAPQIANLIVSAARQAVEEVFTETGIPPHRAPFRVPEDRQMLGPQRGSRALASDCPSASARSSVTTSRSEVATRNSRLGWQLLEDLGGGFP